MLMTYCHFSGVVVIGLVILFYFLCKRFKFDDRLRQLRQIMYNASSTPKHLTSYLDTREDEYEVDDDLSAEDLRSYQTQYTTLSRDATTSRQQTMTKSVHSGDSTLQRESTMKRHFYPNPAYSQNWSVEMEGTTDSFKLRELKTDKTMAWCTNRPLIIALLKKVMGG